MSMSAPDVAELKKKHGDTIFCTPIELPPEAGGAEIDLYWKPPNQGNYRVYMGNLDKRGPEAANRQLFINVVVHPDRNALIDLAENAPLAIAHFLNKGGVTDFFGDSTTVKETRQL